MPFSRPTLTDLRKQTAADLNADLPGADALLRYSNLGIIAALIAEIGNALYGYQDWQAINQVPFTATGEYLEGWAALKGVTRKPAVAAAGQATFVAPADGKTLPAGSPMARADGVGYISTADAVSAGGHVVVPIASTTPGSSTNGDIGVMLTLGIGVSGISPNGTVTAAVAGGSDIETDDDLRSRMLTAYASPPQGGARADYIEWALAVPGVTRCWVYPTGKGSGTIVILFMMDDAEAGHSGFPQGTDGVATSETRDTAAAGDQLILANALFDLQPVTALVYAQAPTPNTIALTIAGIAGASGATKTAINAAIDTALRLDAVPGGVTNISAIEGAIAAVAGTAGFVITLVTASAGTVEPGAAGNITSDAGALPVRGAVIYV